MGGSICLMYQHPAGSLQDFKKGLILADFRDCAQYLQLRDHQTIPRTNSTLFRFGADSPAISLLGFCYFSAAYLSPSHTFLSMVSGIRSNLLIDLDFVFLYCSINILKSLSKIPLSLISVAD